MADKIVTIRAALESADAGVWDKHYGKGLCVEYARRVNAEICAALSALDALQEERERMQADSRRLDAMIEHSWKVVHMPSHKDGPWHVWKPRSPELQRVHVATADDPRAAIDAAIGEPAASHEAGKRYGDFATDRLGTETEPR